MPQIIVQAAPGDRPGAVTLQERINGNDLNSDHFAGQLVERIGWALTDAEDLEDSAEHVGRTQGPDVGDRRSDLRGAGKALNLD
jgi:hypothetical protein